MRDVPDPWSDDYAPDGRGRRSVVGLIAGALLFAVVLGAFIIGMQATAKMILDFISTGGGG